MKRLKIKWANGTFESSYSNMDNNKTLDIVAKVGEKIVKRTTVMPTSDGLVRTVGKTKLLWMDEEDNVYEEADVKFFYEDIAVDMLPQTKILEAGEEAPLDTFNDEFIIDAYYWLEPSDNSEKKDTLKQQATELNKAEMYKLWQYLNANRCVLRGAFNVSSRSFIQSEGYIRGLSNGDKWALELSVFKKVKLFQWYEAAVAPVMAEKKAGISFLRR